VIDEAAAADVLADVEQPASNLPLIIGVAALIVIAIAVIARRRRTRR
jgi:NAD/NADP transhydrogenase alpha subunit